MESYRNEAERYAFFTELNVFAELIYQVEICHFRKKDSTQKARSGQEAVRLMIFGIALNVEKCSYPV